MSYQIERKSLNSGEYSAGKRGTGSSFKMLIRSHSLDFFEIS